MKSSNALTKYVALIYDGKSRHYSKKFRSEDQFMEYMNRGKSDGWGHLYLMATGHHEVSVFIPKKSCFTPTPPKRAIKKHCRGVGNVYPCKHCGRYPEWGSGFLLCAGDHYESVCNEPNGAAVRDWNKYNGPVKKQTRK